MAPWTTVAAVSAPTAASTGEDMSMGASQVAENVSPQVVMVTGKPVVRKRVRMTQESLLAALSSPR
jgi:2-succinyl-5-enolpyruvyl-6-hydroxy-3-cyclohexene-1-carboxylate synthase